MVLPRAALKYLITEGGNAATNSDADPGKVTREFYIGQVVLAIPYTGYHTPQFWGFQGAFALLPPLLSLLALLFLEVRAGPAWWRRNKRRARPQPQKPFREPP